MSDQKRATFEEYRRDAMALDADKARRSSGRSTGVGYSVEARHRHSEPRTVAGRIFDERWREVGFEEGPAGVPVRVGPFDRARQHGLYPYAAAQALRWWLHATAEAEPGHGLCLETRLVEHRIEAEHEVTSVAAHDLVSGEDRSNTTPARGAPVPKPAPLGPEEAA